MSAGAEISVPEPSGRFADGMEFKVQFRADVNAIIETRGIGLSRSAFEIETPVEMVKQIMQAREVAFRIAYKSTETDWVFQPRRTRNALVDVVKTCDIPVG